jgi:hypothetical protein
MPPFTYSTAALATCCFNSSCVYAIFSQVLANSS